MERQIFIQKYWWGIGLSLLLGVGCASEFRRDSDVQISKDMVEATESLDKDINDSQNDYALGKTKRKISSDENEKRKDLQIQISQKFNAEEFKIMKYSGKKKYKMLSYYQQNEKRRLFRCVRAMVRFTDEAHLWPESSLTQKEHSYEIGQWIDKLKAIEYDELASVAAHKNKQKKTERPIYFVSLWSSVASVRNKLIEWGRTQIGYRVPADSPETLFRQLKELEYKVSQLSARKKVTELDL